MAQKTAYSTEKGFTLIELSIVLVIIGLIVGAILVGMDMIKAAELRSTISQVQKYQAAVNTFQTKYGALPGDMLSAQAVAFGFFSETTLAGTRGHQDGNGFIEGGCGGCNLGQGEALSFWVHLSQANLIDGSLGTSPNATIVPTTGAVTANVTVPSQSLPASKITPTQYFIIFYTGSAIFNYFYLTPVMTIPTSGAYTFGAVGITPIQAYNMDVKLDDGIPITGVVAAMALNGLPSPSFAPTSTNNTCLIGPDATTPTDIYNRVLATGGNDGSCALRFRFN